MVTKKAKTAKKKVAKKTSTVKKTNATAAKKVLKKAATKKAPAPAKKKTVTKKKSATSKPVAKKASASTLKPSKAALARRSVSAEQRHQMVAALAYQMWENRGRIHGFAELDWLEAERQIDEQLNA